MSYAYAHNTEKKDRRKSAVITVAIAAMILLGLYFYKFTKTQTVAEEVTMMLINFGDSQNGDGTEEPANQEGSKAAVTETVSQPQPEPQPTPVKEIPERIITGQNPKVSAPKVDKASKVSKSTTAAAKTPAKKPASFATKPTTATKGTGDGRGTAAVGNLIRGRGRNPGSQGNTGLPGNAGDPLGGDSNGDSRIGVDRILIKFISGTEGKGGSKPQHNCTASGKISIAYTVDRAGNVISARRSGGSSDPCIVSTSVSWVRQYVKAEPASTSSTGTYRITF